MTRVGRRHRWFRRDRSAGGQSLVEFVLLLPILLMLLLGVADFGRVFHAGVVIESASREAAEAAALEYLRTEDVRPDPADPDFIAYYQRLHETASAAACQEARMLPNTTHSAGPPVSCSQWPAIVVCIHDGADPLCDGTPATGYTAGTSECGAMSGGWATTEDSLGNAYVEVRVCYRFTTLFNLQAAGLSLGDVYLQQRATFTVADY